MTERYFIANATMMRKFQRNLHKQKVASDIIIGWLKNVIGADVQDFRFFTKVPAFTEHHFNLKPELRELCTKNRNWLNSRKPESKALINDWIQYRDTHDAFGVVKRYSPFDDSVESVVREAFPTGGVKFNRNEHSDVIVFESDCDNPNMTLVDEITKVEYLETLIAFEKEHEDLKDNT